MVLFIDKQLFMKIIFEESRRSMPPSAKQIYLKNKPIQNFTLVMIYRRIFGLVFNTCFTSADAGIILFLFLPAQLEAKFFGVLLSVLT